MFNDFDDVISIDDLCSMLSIGKNSAYNLLTTGKIKAFRIGKTWKIPRLSVENYILYEINLHK